MHTAWVYILTNSHKTVLYIGMTNDIVTRIWEHQTKLHKRSFAATYNLSCLVYYEGFELVTQAISREKYLKGKKREWKNQLIQNFNKTWEDLYDQVKHELNR